MKTSLFLLFSFFLGAIPTAYLVTKRVKGIDIRQHGSGNVGATNAFRVLGKKYGALVLFLDFLKGFVPVFLGQALFSPGLPTPLIALIAGVMAILGHIFTPFLGFKGGKGIATGAGVVCMAYPLLFLIALIIWGGTFLLTRTVSLSSLVALASLVPLSYWFVRDGQTSLLFLLLFFLIAWTHRSNIGRILSGKELKIDKKN